MRDRGLSMRAAVAAGFVGACAMTAGAAGASPFASSVLGYDQGVDAASGFTDPNSALGEPTRETSPGSAFGGATTPFQSPFGAGELVSVGIGGSLTLGFDEPIRNDAANPFGVDLLIFGNAFYLDTAFPDGIAGDLFGRGGSVSVSADGVAFVDVPGAPARGDFPTLGFQDPSGPLTTGPDNRVTGTIPSDFTKPVDPAFDAFGLAFTDIVAGYGGSGGGVGIDIGSLGLDSIVAVRIINPADALGAIGIDAVSDVAVPTPGSVLVLLTAGACAQRRRSDRRG